MKASDLCVGVSAATARPVGGASAGLAAQIFHPANEVHREVSDSNVIRRSLIETNTSSGGTEEEEEGGSEPERARFCSGDPDSQTRILEPPAHRELSSTFP